MAADPEDVVIRDNVLIFVSDDYIKKNNGYFEIPDSVTAIRSGVFAYRFSLKQVTIPDSVAMIGNYVFHGCPEDLEITIIASDPYAERAEDVIKMLPKRFREKVKIEFSPEVNQAYVKGDSSSPTFFSTPNEPKEGEHSSNNQNQPGV